MPLVMAGENAVEIHDALMAIKPEGVDHECAVCLPETADAKEEATLSDKTFTEAEHYALLTDSVKRETAELESANKELSAKVEELSGKVDVLEAEKSALTTERDEAKAEFESFKSDLQAKEEAQARKEERMAAMKAAAEHLPEDYFTDERALRWAEMSEEAFEVAVADLIATKPAEVASEDAPEAPETAAFSGGVTPTAVQAGSFSAFLRAGI
jgi:chromosome segregation ATPase